MLIMRIFSSRSSVQAGEVTLLAVAETVAATTLLFYLAIWTRSLYLVAIVASFSPLLLLRTKKTQEISVRIFVGAFFRIIAEPQIRLATYIESKLAERSSRFQQKSGGGPVKWRHLIIELIILVILILKEFI